MICDHAVTAAAVVAVLPVPKQAVCGRRCSPRSAGAARSSGTAWEVSSWTTNTWACAATSGAATRGAAGGQGEEDDREVRRTGDRVHCAADSATYGRDCCLVSAGKVSGRTPPRAGQSRTPCAVC